MIGGVTVNILLGIFIYSMILFAWGKAYLPANEAVYGVDVSPYLQEIGFANGDRIVSLNSNPVPDDYTYQNIYQELMLDNTIQTVTVLRNNEEVEISLPSDFKAQMLTRKEKSPFMERIPFVADTILPKSTAGEAGIMKGDAFQSVAGQPAVYFMDFVHAVGQHKGETVDITVLRNNELVTLPVEVTENGKIGVGNRSILSYFNVHTKSYGFFESLPAGGQEAYETVVNYIRQFKLVFTKEGIGQVGGFGAIGNLFPSEWDWQVFWRLTAFLSMVLAFMNILPIPALDGGHVLFLLYEMISGKAPGEKFMEYAQMTGMILLIGLMLLANGNDIVRALFD
jgi:regulator of sigma E protease